MKVLTPASATLLAVLAFVQRVAGSGLLVEFNQDLLSAALVPANLRLAAQDVNITAIKFADPEIQLREGEVLDLGGTEQSTASLSLLAATKSKSATRAMPWAFARQLTSEAGLSVQNNPNAGQGGVVQVGTPCSDTSSVGNGPPVKVLVAMSNCISESSTYRPDVNGWIANLIKQDSRYFNGDTASKIDFVLQSVDDQCVYSQSETIPRFEANTGANYVAVIAVTYMTKMYYTLKNHVAARNIPTFIAFEVTPVFFLPGVIPAPGTPAGYMGQFDPFTISRKIHCKSLPGSIPTSYVNAAGQRNCFCSCPVGYKLSGGSCVAVEDSTCFCAWKQNAGFKFEVAAANSDKYTSSGTCSIKNLAIKTTAGVTSGLLPVPVALDNYVDHLRTNDGDAANPLGTTSPHIELQKKKIAIGVKKGATGTEVVEEGDNGVTTPFTWTVFQSGSTAKIDALEFKKAGRYSIELKARDYSADEATCEGCVIVHDKRRPTINPSVTCPTSVGSVTTELTLANLLAAQTKINGIQAVKDNALNDPCGTNVRCDVDSYSSKAFVDANYGTACSTLADSSAFFASSTVKEDLAARLSGNPFDNTKPNGIATSVATGTATCTRCAKVSTKLKEWWTPYTCASTSAVSECDGLDSEKCDLEQCVTVNGNTLATTTAALKSTVKDASLAVVKSKKGNEDKSDDTLKSEFSIGAKVHVALECTKFPTPTTIAQALLADGVATENDLISVEKCTYEKKVSDLIDITTLKKISPGVTDSLFSDTEVQNFVKWRYRIDSGTWAPWSESAPAVTFNKYSTTITVEAWTQCGKVETYTFYVVLHLNNEIKVCENFDNMWYQTSNAPLKLSNQYCMYPKSDFAELTFDYHPNIGLAFDTDKFQMSIDSVKCELKYDGAASTTILDTDTFSSPKSFQIVKQFAIDGVDVATTKKETKLSATCVFTYGRKVDSSKVIQSCSRSFTIVDCTPPVISKPCALDGKCDFNQCASTSVAKPDLYQSCGGNRVTQSSAGATVLVDGADATCCPSCQTAYFQPTCTEIGENPSGVSSSFKFIKRCEPKPTTAGLMLEAAVAQKAEAADSTTTTTTALLGVSALVAVVALVAVRHRRAANAKAKAMVEDDAYYPLMG